MIKLYYPNFWQKKSFLAYILLPFGLIFLMLGYLRKILAEPAKFPAFTICVGNCTVGGTGKTQLIITLAKEFRKRNINFIIFSKGYGGKCTVPALVTASSSPEEVGDEALELCKFGNSFVIPKFKDALPIIEKYKPDIILVDDGMQNPYFKKDMLIMTIDGARGFGNGFPIPAGPMRSSFAAAIDYTDIIVINGKSELKFDLDEPKYIFNAINISKHKFKNYKYYAFAGIGNPDKFFNLLKEHGAKIEYSESFPDHYKYTKEDIENLVKKSKENNLKLITTRKDYVKIQASKLNINNSFIPAFEYIGLCPTIEKREIPEIECFEVELKIENYKMFLSLIFNKLKKYQQLKK